MKLTRVIMSGFRSVKNTEELLIDDKVTILIGANDHGKSNILEALLRLNDNSPILENDKNWDLAIDKEPQLEWHFHVDNNELDDLQKPPTLPDNMVHTKSYDENNNQEIVYCKAGINAPLKVIGAPYSLPDGIEKSLLKLRPKVEPFLKPITTNLRKCLKS